jgi:hypothetical protein
MTPVIGVVAIVGLVVAWVLGRTTAKAIRRKRQLKPKRRRPARVIKRKTSRSEMRAADDPTTIAGEMNTTTRPPLDQPQRK